MCTAKSSKACASIEFVSATYVEGLEGVDGIAGMSTGLSEWSEGPLFVEELFS